MNETEYVKPKRANPKNLAIFAIVAASTKGFWTYLGTERPTLKLWSEEYPTVRKSIPKSDEFKKIKAELYMRVDVHAIHVRESRIDVAGFPRQQGWACWNNKGKPENWFLIFHKQEDASIIYDDIHADEYEW